jgi:hypothetical protein
MSGLNIRSPGPIIQIGEAIARRLEVAFPPARFSHEFMPAKLDAAQWMKLLRRTPFVGLGFVDIEPLHESGSMFVGPVSRTVFLVSRNEGGPRQRFYGDKLAPGVLQMTQVAVAMLQGHTLLDGTTKLGTIGALRAVNAYAEDWKDDTIAAVQISLHVPITFGLADVVDGEATVAATLAGTTVQWSFDSGASTALIENTTGGA